MRRQLSDHSVDVTFIESLIKKLQDMTERAYADA